MKKLIIILLILALLPACALAMTSSEFSRYLVYNYDDDTVTVSCFAKIPDTLKLSESEEYIWRLGYAQALKDQQEKDSPVSEAPAADDGEDPLIGVWYTDIGYPYPSIYQVQHFHNLHCYFFLATGEIISADIKTYYDDPHLTSDYTVFGTWKKTGVFSYEIKDESGIIGKLYILNDTDLYVLSSPSEYIIYHKMTPLDFDHDFYMRED